jgi:hypothetical protein
MLAALPWEEAPTPMLQLTRRRTDWMAFGRPGVVELSTFGSCDFGLDGGGDVEDVAAGSAGGGEVAVVAAGSAGTAAAALSCATSASSSRFGGGAAE